jgi:hypothetical protein
MRRPALKASLDSEMCALEAGSDETLVCVCVCVCVWVLGDVAVALEVDAV